MFRKVRSSSIPSPKSRRGGKRWLLLVTILTITVFMSACNADLFQKLPFLSDLQSAIEELVPPSTPSGNATRPAYAPSGESDFAYYGPVLAESSQRYMTADDVENLSTMERLLARCEIFARHGVIFNDPTLASFFEDQYWYQGTIQQSAFDQAALNEYESANLQLIEVYDKIASGEYEPSFNNPYLPYYDPATELLVPQNSYNQLTERDLAGLSKEQVIIVRNQIMALHGYTFSDQALMEYFLRCSWYRPSTPPGRPDLVTGMTDLEHENMSFINRYEENSNAHAQVPPSQVVDSSIVGTWCSGRGNYTEDGLFSVCFGDYWYFNADGTFTRTETESQYLYNPDGTENTIWGAGALDSKGVFSFDGANLTVTTTHSFDSSSGPYIKLDPPYVKHATVSYDGDVLLVNWGGNVERFYRETGDALVKRLMREQEPNSALDLSKLDKSLSYSLSNDIFSVVVPAYWQEYAVITTPSINGLPAISFYEAPDYNGCGGHLFTIRIEAASRDLQFPNYSDLGVFSEGRNYFRLIVLYPSDVQWSDQNRKLYSYMDSEASRILGTLTLTTGYNFVEYDPSLETD